MRPRIRSITACFAALLFATGAAAAGAAEITINGKDGGGVDVLMDGRVVMAYVPGDAKTLRPYFAHVKTPSGIQVTRNHPPAGNDPADHADMHPGFWLAFSDVGGRDFWRNKGPTIKQQQLIVRPGGGFDVVHDFIDGDQVLCRQSMTYDFIARPVGYLVVLESQLTPLVDGLWLGDAEEMGLGVRPATAITVKSGNGRIASSHGGENEKGTWGKPADWVDYSGTIDGKRVGVTLMVSPDNSHKSWFHTRDYGLIVANSFGERVGRPARHPLKKGETLRMTFGVLVHESAASNESPDLAAEYKGFAGEAVELFDGKTLAGWDGDPRLWSVRDGAIRGETTADKPADGNTFLIWKNGTLKDFDLRLSFRLGGDNNSGIQYRSRHAADDKRNAWAVKGYQAEVRNESDLVGFIYDEGGKRRRMCLVGERVVWSGGKKNVVGSLGDADAIAKTFRPGEWNEYRIVARGNHVRHFINGVQRIDFTDNDPQLALREGVLALQLHQGKPMWVEFKDLRLKRF